jgi:hypothetical protein
LPERRHRYACDQQQAASQRQKISDRSSHPIGSHPAFYIRKADQSARDRSIVRQLCGVSSRRSDFPSQHEQRFIEPSQFSGIRVETPRLHLPLVHSLHRRLCACSVTKMLQIHKVDAVTIYECRAC